MSSSYVQFSTPALRRFHHTDVNVDSNYSIILNPPTLPSRRVIVLIQNKSESQVEVTYGDSEGAGIFINPMQTVSVDNYNGIVKARSWGGYSVIHIAYSEI